jgi:hypothetical protein
MLRSIFGKAVKALMKNLAGKVMDVFFSSVNALHIIIRVC